MTAQELRQLRHEIRTLHEVRDLLSGDIRKLKATNAQLLEALRVADHALEVAGFQDIQPIRATVRAAIAAAEGEQ